MNTIKDLIMKDLETITIIKPIKHPCLRSEVENLTTQHRVLMHACSILSDVQHMVLYNAKKEEINSEINEAKFFIGKVMEYQLQNPECPLKTICPYYKRVKNLVHPYFNYLIIRKPTDP